MTYRYNSARYKKQSPSLSGPVAGGSSVIMILAVLCLTVFAALTITASESERNSALIYAESVKNYYKADLKASRFTAALMSAANTEDIKQLTENSGAVVEEKTDNNGTVILNIVYQTEIDENQLLEVRLKASPAGKNGVRIDILQWTPVFCDEWSPHNGLNLYSP